MRHLLFIYLFFCAILPNERAIAREGYLESGIIPGIDLGGEIRSVADFFKSSSEAISTKSVEAYETMYCYLTVEGGAPFSVKLAASQAVYWTGYFTIEKLNKEVFPKLKEKLGLKGHFLLVSIGQIIALHVADATRACLSGVKKDGGDQEICWNRAREQINKSFSKNLSLGVGVGAISGIVNALDVKIASGQILKMSGAAFFRHYFTAFKLLGLSVGAGAYMLLKLGLEVGIFFFAYPYVEQIIEDPKQFSTLSRVLVIDQQLLKLSADPNIGTCKLKELWAEREVLLAARHEFEMKEKFEMTYGLRTVEKVLEVILTLKEGLLLEKSCLGRERDKCRKESIEKILSEEEQKKESMLSSILSFGAKGEDHSFREIFFQSRSGMSHNFLNYSLQTREYLRDLEKETVEKLELDLHLGPLLSNFSDLVWDEKSMEVAEEAIYILEEVLKDLQEIKLRDWTFKANEARIRGMGLSKEQTKMQEEWINELLREKKNWSDHFAKLDRVAPIFSKANGPVLRSLYQNETGSYHLSSLLLFRMNELASGPGFNYLADEACSDQSSEELRELGADNVKFNKEELVKALIDKNIANGRRLRSHLEVAKAVEDILGGNRSPGVRCNF